MRQQDIEKLDGFKTYLKDLEYMGSAFGVLYWDSRVNIPPKGLPYRGEVLGYLSNQLYKLQTSDTLRDYIGYFSDVAGLDDVTKAMVKHQKKEFDRTMKIPEQRYREYAIATSNAEAAWEQAKKASDYSIFMPHLQKVIDFNREFIGYWGEGSGKYNTLLDYYEPGITIEKLDKAFDELGDTVVSLLERIAKSNVKTDDSFFKAFFKKSEQEDFCKYILEKMGYDFLAGRVDISTHPFATAFENRDVRITTNYNEHEFRTSLFSCIHEGGHALYEQDIPDELKGTMLATGVSMGIHESQSRFYENLIGRSRAFWQYFSVEAKKRFAQFDKTGPEDFYRGVNAVQPSFIRIEADELTYNLHIIIRYEVEKAIFEDGVNAKDLPQLWNEKYFEYLGIRPQNDGEGILQDMHWSGGSFGYFPSYALGNLYGAQFLNRIKKDVPDLESRIAAGDLGVLHTWLAKNVHRYGAVYEPEELMQKATGETLQARYYIEYLNKKYSELYDIG